MVRRVWRAVEIPQGWFNVIRGPRPPSERWPMAQGNRQPPKVDHGRRGRWRHQRGRQGASRNQSFQPERVRRFPEVNIVAARQRVAQLEGALAAFGDATGPEATMLQNSLKVAKKVAREPPLSAVEFVRVVRFKGPEIVGGSRRSTGVVVEGARRRRATDRKVAGRSDGESATSDRCGVRDCCVESGEVGVGGGREGRCSGGKFCSGCKIDEQICTTQR